MRPVNVTISIGPLRVAANRLLRKRELNSDGTLYDKTRFQREPISVPADLLLRNAQCDENLHEDWR